MQTQEHRKQFDNLHKDSRFPWGRVSLVVFVLLLVAVGTTLWIYVSSSAAILFGILFTAFGVVFAFLQLVPSLFSHNPESSQTSPVIIQIPQNQPAPIVLLPSRKFVHNDEDFLENADSLSEIQYSMLELFDHHKASSAIYNVPYQRNPFFTARESVLKDLYNAFRTGPVGALRQTQAITGLGGIGKTQTAIEYAYRNRSSYQTILWLNAQSRETLASGFVSICDQLNLLEKNQQDPTTRDVPTRCGRLRRFMRVMASICVRVRMAGARGWV